MIMAFIGDTQFSLLILCIIELDSNPEQYSEFLIGTMDGFCDGKTSNIASWHHDDPLRMVELGGPADDKVEPCTTQIIQSS